MSASEAHKCHSSPDSRGRGRSRINAASALLALAYILFIILRSAPSSMYRSKNSARGKRSPRSSSLTVRESLRTMSRCVSPLCKRNCRTASPSWMSSSLRGPVPVMTGDYQDLSCFPTASRFLDAPSQPGVPWISGQPRREPGLDDPRGARCTKRRSIRPDGRTSP